MLRKNVNFYVIILSTKRVITHRILPFAAAILISLPGLGSASVEAYGGSGSGTIGDPYLITNCTELQSIHYDDFEGLGATDYNYKLVNDIDCSATTGWNDGDGFLPLGYGGYEYAGDFDGNDKTISDLYINRPSSNGSALFNATYQANIHDLTLENAYISGDSSVGSIVGGNDGTIDNITVSADIHGNFSVGGIVGSNYGDISNVHMSGDMDISDESENMGGIIGTMHGGNLSDCSYSGDMISHTSSGGLVGTVSDSGQHTIDRCFSEGSITTDSEIVGGIVGTEYTDDLVISNSYSTMDINAENGWAVGGIVGSGGTSLVITNSYFNGTVTGDSDVGGIIGYRSPNQVITNSYATGLVTANSGYGGITGNDDDSEYNSVFWNKQTTGQTFSCNESEICSGTTGKTTTQMKSSNTIVSGGWDTATIWGVTSAVNNGYPCLRWQDGCVMQASTDGDNITDTTENAAPNSGDANNDSTPDSEQPSVSSFVSPVTGKYATLQSDCTSNGDTSVDPESNSVKDAGYDYPTGLMNFTLECTVGATATITQYFYGDFDASDFIARKYNPDTNSYTTIPGAALSNVTIGGESALKIVYSVTDGGDLDQDGIANGTIVDPSGPGQSVVGTPNTGLGGQVR